jgi:SAM-dependent methyltransferase
MTPGPLPLLCVAALILNPVFATGQEVVLDVPYVATPREVVVEMLKMAEIGKGDVVYDLGCGDGRIVIAAAKDMGARGVGIDKDPRRIKECIVNAAAAQVSDRVSFREEDLFQTDFSEATVVSMYLLQMINLTLRPKLLQELKPGSRIISHNFDMRDWKPDKAKNIGSHSIYCWIVPANVTGVWEGIMPVNFGGGKFTLRLRQDFQKISGEITLGSVTRSLTATVLTGAQLRFSFPWENADRKTTGQFRGSVSENSLRGTMARPGESGTSIEALRDPSTMTEIHVPGNE